MNNMKKIGLSALAGSLVATSAFAGSLDVSGSWEVTYKGKTATGATDGTAGNPFGSKTAVVFSGSGDVDGVGTASFMTVLDDSGADMGSSLMTLDMGDLGTFGFDKEVGQYGFSTIDDKAPTAWEESWHGTTTSSAHLGNTGGTVNALGYSNSFMGVDISLEYVANVGNTSVNGDDASSGHTTNADGSNTNIAITSSALLDGLTVGVGAGETDYDDEAAANKTDGSSVGGFFTYSFGPATVGYTQTYSDGLRTDNLTTHAMDVESMGIAININDSLSVSWSELEATKDKSDGTADVTEEFQGIAVSYTMGGATLALQQNEVDNLGHVTGVTEDVTLASLSLAF